LDSTGRVSETVCEEGDTFVFSTNAFEWDQVYAPDGDYMVGSFGEGSGW